MTFRRRSHAACAISLFLLASAVSGQAPAQGPVTVLSRDGRRALQTVEAQGRTMVGLDDLASLLQLAVREDAAARAVTVTYRNQTIVLTPDQALASSSGRLVSLPAPLTRQGSRWLVPVEFISRALAPIYDARLDFRPESRLLIVGDLRVPTVTADYDAGGGALRVTLMLTPRTTAAVTQDQGRLLVRVDADALDAALPPPPQQGLLTGIRAVDPNTIQLDLGPRFASYRSAPPVSTGAAAQLTIDLLPAATLDSSASAPSPSSPSAAPVAPSPGTQDLPVFGGTRASIRTIVLDPGHGGDDAGAKGPGGTLEKDVALAVARRTKSAIEGRLGIRVLLTRDDDATTDADSRAAIANNNKADLFISLHANGSLRAAARGAQIFYLSLDRFGEAVRLQSQANREVIPVYGGGVREFALVDWELAQAAYLQESAALAGLADQKLRQFAGMPRVAVKKAPMRNLAGANMPAILIEMGYLTNPDEEKQLASAEFQNGIAHALTEAVIGFRNYLEAPSPRSEAP